MAWELDQGFYTFDDAKAAARHTTQYFEIGGNRAIYSEGWVAAVVHKAPWEAEPGRKLADDVGELYNFLLPDRASPTPSFSVSKSQRSRFSSGMCNIP
jgi:arylsulfatase A-like enzyme